MLPPQAAYHLRKALLWSCAIGGCAAVGAAAAGGWRAGLGVAGGAGSMAGALEVSALRSLAMLPGGEPGSKMQALVGRAVWLVGTLGAFWLMLDVVRVPGWSVAVGVTACVAGSAVGFLTKAPEEKG